MNARRLLSYAVASLLACSCSVPRPRAPLSVSPAVYFPATIAHIEQTDAGSPALLNARLAYGEYLLSEAPGPCAQRIVVAQEQLGSVDASAKRRVMFPDGWARVDDLEYRLQLARAECGSKADDRDDLLAAVEAARRAVNLYRNVFDYHSMVVMQFDAAVTLYRLGDDAGAVKTLETALDMDREYGFADDARQNYKLLLTWQGQPSGAAQVAALMESFPKRRVTLKFDWQPGIAHVTLKGFRACLEDGQIVHAIATANYERHIGTDPSGGWSVTYAHRIAGYQPGVWPIERDSVTAQLSFPPLRLPALDFNVSAKGEFKGATDSKAFSDRLTAMTNAIIKAGAPPPAPTPDVKDDAADSTAMALSPGMLEAATAENYQLETAMWVGAKLEQGVWYELSAPLTLPGLTRLALQQRIEFAFTRMVPCTPGAAEQRCVEIVIHATPDPQALHGALDDMASPILGESLVNYNASIEARIVVDPATLLPYARDERVLWYGSFGKDMDESVLESDRLMSTMTYGAQ